MTLWRLPLTELHFGAEEKAAANRVLESGWLSMGPEVAAFEEEFALFLRVKHAAACSSATAALHLSLLALGIGPGDEVIQPALNFVAAANMTLNVGATPVFADITSLSDPTINPDEVCRLITKRTKAVLIMHYAGNLCRVKELLNIAARHGIVVIEDSCHALGAKLADHHGTDAMAGGIGKVGTFSFFANKNLATGEGGMVVTSDDVTDQRIRALRSHGMTSLTWDRHRGHASAYDVTQVGYNYRLDELRAAIGRAQLRKLSSFNQHRRAIITHYVDNLKQLSGWNFPYTTCDEETSSHLMVAVAPDAKTKQKVLERLRSEGIQTSMHYPCVCDFSAFRKFVGNEVPTTREFARRAITLPLSSRLSFEQVDLICSVILGVI